LHGAAKSTEHTRIDLIGFGQNASRTSILPHPIGQHQTDFDRVLLGRIEHRQDLAAALFCSTTAQLPRYKPPACGRFASRSVFDMRKTAARAVATAANSFV
jgi:hypothetical protein